jgi:DNA-directed RNA polymerase specialized sigma24 family protein
MPEAHTHGQHPAMGVPAPPPYLALCLRHKDALYRFAFAMTGSEPAAAAIAVDVLVRTAHAKGVPEEPGDLLVRLLRDTVRAVGSSERKRARTQSGVQTAGVRFEAGTEPSSLGPLFGQETTREVVHAAIAALPVSRRTVLVACDVLTLPDAHVAALVRCSPSDVRDRLERARADFQTELLRLTGDAE